MTPQTSAELRAAIIKMVQETEKELNHTLRDTDRDWLINHYHTTLQRRCTKFIKGAIEHDDDESFLHINFIDAIRDEIDDLDHYVGGLESHLAARRKSRQDLG